MRGGLSGAGLRAGNLAAGAGGEEEAQRAAMAARMEPTHNVRPRLYRTYPAGDSMHSMKMIAYGRSLKGKASP